MTAVSPTLKKPSNLRWVSELPATWQEQRLGSLLDEIDERGNDDLPVLSVSIHHGVSNRQLLDEEMDRVVQRSEDKTKYKAVQPGDLVYNMMRAWQGGFGSVTVPGMISPAYVATRPKPGAEIDTRFLELMLRTPAAIEELRCQSYGITDFRLRLYWENFRNIRVPLPPIEEQKAIVAFLDRETGRIDALVERLERLIVLLTEKRQAVISHAVTKGLNPDAPMLDSGIDWLGEFPAHWQRKRLYTFARFVQGKAHEPFFDADGEYACATARFVSTGGQTNRFSTRNITPAKPGDVLMVMSDLPNGRALARAYLVKSDDRIAINQRVCGITIQDGDPRYFAYQLNRHEELLRYNDGWNQTHLKNEYFTQLVLNVPHPSEQSQIADFLDAELSEIGRLSENAASMIEGAKERRSALISAAVTGQIPLADMTEEAAA
ncbi:restriction endonuclease subunit S [Alisedimentitalea sp. MJ-SS2]|uniref:restriction endonuclease subunit S n=1 Tax=Aliisedimentitalea sp. MJ-SS2 TaxID=3049795 RepID=UPI00290A691F|nr:restriction endonuclease subunit S [Alisedimentitalea sp. MJ-SS2]MDU8928315.1 restriction endonuclease subunit S [Alisedimentitalea sp. MJ-SS2]